MAIVMLGPDGRIRRFTQPAERVLNLIHADIGRPFSDLKVKLDVPDLDAMVGEVIANISTVEREVRDPDGRWYSLRIRPYRTADNKIDGAVLMLVDIDSLKRSEQSVRDSEQRYEVLADSAPVLIWVAETGGCRFVNRAFEEFVGASESEICRRGIAAFLHSDDCKEYLDRYEQALAARTRFKTRARMRRSDGTYTLMMHLGAPRLASNGEVVGFVGTSIDVSEMGEAAQTRLGKT
jgi:PAS domain S-box-containing protein